LENKNITINLRKAYIIAIKKMLIEVNIRKETKKHEKINQIRA